MDKQKQQESHKYKARGKKDGKARSKKVYDNMKKKTGTKKEKDEEKKKRRYVDKISKK